MCFSLPSANKTPNLGLNNWCGSDKPKCSDFVQDNLLIDEAFHNHASDSDLHFSPADRARLNNLVSTGYYVGSGDTERTISLSFSPSFLFVFSSGQLPVSNGNVHFGFACQQFSSAGLSLNASSLTLSQTDGFSLNQSGKTYAYVALR